MHLSIPVEDSIEIIEQTEISPLISYCKIKVCYVSDEPNRNNTVINKETAEAMGKLLPGSPIVGLYKQEDEDFDQHSRQVNITSNGVEMIDITKPYGFVDLGAKVWFQKFLDDDSVEREYLCTEGYIWTGAYPESKRIVEIGNNQSMELNGESIKGTWAGEINSPNRFFIINEAIIEKLCVLGENVEPCFEGAQIKASFSLQEEFEQFKNTMYSMINELKDSLNKGGKDQMEIKEYAVDLGGALYEAIRNAIWDKFNGKDTYYYIHGIYEEGEQKFAILTSENLPGKYFRLDFTYSEAGFECADELVEVTLAFDPVTYAAQFPAEQHEEAQEQEAAASETYSLDQEEEVEEQEVDTEEKLVYNLDEIVEYVELKNQFEELQAQYSAIQEQLESIASENETLKQFKLAKDLEAKQNMINSFYMLSDEDKQDVVSNIEKYSLEDIEAKLSILCVRNKVSFNLDTEQVPESNGTTFNLEAAAAEENSDVPEWVRAVKETQKNI